MPHSRTPVPLNDFPTVAFHLSPAGNWQLISIDHEIDSRKEAKHSVINRKIADFLDAVQSVEANGTPHSAAVAFI